MADLCCNVARLATMLVHGPEFSLLCESKLRHCVEKSD